LLFGCYRLPASERREAIEEYLGRVVASSFADGQIAAVARTNDLVLATLNLMDYEGFRDLRVEDWAT